MCSVQKHSGRHSLDCYACIITPCHRVCVVCVCVCMCVCVCVCSFRPCQISHSSLVVYEGMSVSHWLKDLVSIYNGLLLLPMFDEYRYQYLCVWVCVVRVCVVLVHVHMRMCVSLLWVWQTKQNRQCVRESGRDTEQTDRELHVDLFKDAQT